MSQWTPGDAATRPGSAGDGGTRAVVVCSLERWDEVWRRNQYLVTELLAVDPLLQFLFVEPPIDRWSPAQWPSVLRRHPVPAIGVDRVWTLQPIKPLPRRLGPLSDVVIRWQVRRAAASLGLDRPVLWINDVHFVGLVRPTGWPALYDITDDWVAEDSVPARVRRRRRRLEAKALRSCREVVVCSPSLQESRGQRRSVRLIPNGVDVRLITEPQARPRDLPDGPVAVYVGTVQTDRFDVDLVLETADANPAIRMVIVGPVVLASAAERRLRSRPNVVLLGARRHDLVPGYLQHADVVIVPHLINDFTESLDPIKVYECLTLRVPTVATAVAGFRGRGAPIEIASRERFPAAVGAAAGRRVEPNLPPDATWRGRAASFYTALRAAERGRSTED